MGLTLACAAVALFFASPSHWEGMREKPWRALEKQFRHPLKARQYPPESHQAKLAFRLTVPIVVHVTRTGIPGAITLQILSALGLLYLTASLAFEITDDRVLAALITLATAMSYVGFSGFWETRGMFDTLAIGLLVAAMRTRSPGHVALLVLLAGFTDERGLVASVFVYLWFVVRSLPADDASPRLAWFPREGWGVAGAIAAYLAIRLLLGTLYGLRTPIGNQADVGPAVFAAQIRVFPVGVWTALESLWLPVLAALALLLTSRLRHFGVVLAGALVTVLVVANCAIDVTRGATYVFPVVFVALRVLAVWETRETLQTLGLWSVLIGVLVPNVYMQGIFVNPCYGTPVIVGRYLLRLLGW